MDNENIQINNRKKGKGKERENSNHFFSLSFHFTDPRGLYFLPFFPPPVPESESEAASASISCVLCISYPFFSYHFTEKATDNTCTPAHPSMATQTHASHSYVKA